LKRERTDALGNEPFGPKGERPLSLKRSGASRQKRLQFQKRRPPISLRKQIVERKALRKTRRREGVFGEANSLTAGSSGARWKRKG